MEIVDGVFVYIGTVVGFRASRRGFSTPSASSRISSTRCHAASISVTAEAEDEEEEDDNDDKSLTSPCSEPIWLASIALECSQSSSPPSFAILMGMSASRIAVVYDISATLAAVDHA